MSFFSHQKPWNTKHLILYEREKWLHRQMRIDFSWYCMWLWLRCLFSGYKLQNCYFNGVDLQGQRSDLLIGWQEREHEGRDRGGKTRKEAHVLKNKSRKFGLEWKMEECHKDVCTRCPANYTDTLRRRHGDSPVCWSCTCHQSIQ